MILAAEHGRIGERYLVSERMFRFERRGADCGRRGWMCHRRNVLFRCRCFIPWPRRQPERRGSPGKDAQLSLASVRMMRSEADVDSSKAKRELGWQPRPVRGIDPRGRPVLERACARRKRTARPRNLIGAAGSVNAGLVLQLVSAFEEGIHMSHREVLEPSAGHPIAIEPTKGRVQVRHSTASSSPTRPRRWSCGKPLSLGCNTFRSVTWSPSG